MKRILTFLALLLILIGSLPQQAYSTITTTASTITLAGNGSTNQFAFPFVADSSADIAVIYTNAQGQETTIPATQYSVAINNPPPGQLWGVGGTVTYPLAGSPIASGTTITVQRILPLIQTTNFSNQGDFYPQVTEQSLDIATMQVQQTSARTGQIRGTWLTSTVYNYGDMVVDGANGNNTGNIYLCSTSNTSGVWSTDLAAGDWVLALNVQSIVNSLPSISNNQLFGNISGITATPTGVGGSAFLDAVFGSSQGSILYRGSSLWTTLPPGTNGYFLETQGAGANPLWVAAGGGIGTITGVTAGTGLTGGGVSGNVAVSLATQANQTILANVSGMTAASTPTTLSALLDNILGSTQGNVIYRGGTLWGALGPGTNGQVLQTQGAGANPQWATVSANAANIQIFTATGAHTWTKPGAATKTYVQCWGAGGGGGGDANGGGGGGGSYIDRWYSASSLGATEAVSIGTGGAGCNGSTGCSAGGNSTFSSSGNLLTAYGGGGGSNQAGGGGAGVLGAGGTAGSSTPGTAGTGGGAAGTFNTPAVDAAWPDGGGGGARNGNGGNSYSGGGGGAGQVGSSVGGGSVLGGNGGNCGSPGGAGAQPAGGGGGTCSPAGGGVNGGKGGDGECIVTTFP